MQHPDGGPATAAVPREGSRLLPRTRLALAALAGAAGVLCFAPFGLFWLAPLLWAGFLALLLTAPSPRAGFATGFAFGLAFFLAGVSWVYVSLSVFGGMAWWLAGPAAFYTKAEF